MGIGIRVGGVWKTPTATKVRVGGVWRDAQAFIRVSGTWRTTKSIPVTYCTQVTNTSDAKNYTFSSVAIGTAATDRKVFVALCANGSVGVGLDFTSVTIGGVSATCLQRNNYNGVGGEGICVLEVWWASVPTGTTATIEASHSCTNLTRCHISTWAVYGATSTSYITTGTVITNQTVLSMSAVFPSGGPAIAVFMGDTPATATLGNVTERYDVSPESGMHASGGDIIPSASGTVNISCTLSASQARISGIVVQFQ